MRTTTSKLTNLQLELLKIFSYEVGDTQLKEIKLLLANYFAIKATDAADTLWEQNKLNNKIMKEWANGHFRTEYKTNK